MEKKQFCRKLSFGNKFGIDAQTIPISTVPISKGVRDRIDQ
jgi:hypothetical protein